MARKGRNRKTRQPKRTFTIIVDGETEKWYLDLLKQHESSKLPNINIKPDIPKKTALEDLYKKVKEAADNMLRDDDKVIWIIDTDVILREIKAKPSVKNEFNKYYNELSALNNVHILANTPCLEYWILLHFKDTSKFFSACDNAQKAVQHKSCMPEYTKKESFYKKQNNDIYKRLKPTQNDAIKRGTKLGTLDLTNLNQAKAEMYQLFEILELPQS